MGANVNGPSLVKVPGWVEAPLGRYYLYFAHHNGGYIRLAYADALTGPWKTHEPGSLQHAQSFFPPELDLADVSKLPPGFVVSTPHIASPDVVIDEEQQRFVMYYHGIRRDRSQVTRVATSSNGIDFEARDEVVGNPYFRAFRHGDWHYGMAMPGVFYRSRDGISGFESGPRLFAPNMRHAALLVEGDTLTVFYTNVGEEPPERILAAAVDLSKDWMEWEATPPSVVLEPERDYEGADLPLVASIRGEITARARQLRDPTIYAEDGRLYLLYSVAGESGIGLAELTREA